MSEAVKGVKKILFDFFVQKGIINKEDIGRIVINLNRGGITDIWTELKKL